MAAELEADIDDVEIVLVPSGGGVFEVEADGRLLHSKKATGRFPAPGEIVAALRDR